MRAGYAENETGLKGQYELFKRVCDVTGDAPYVFDGSYVLDGPYVLDGELLKKSPKR